MTPFSQYKAWLAEGGIRNALIVSGPVVQRPKGSIDHQAVMHVADIMPTLLEVAGTSYPKTYKGKDVPPALGKSWGPSSPGRPTPPDGPGRSRLGALRQPSRPAGELEVALGDQALRQGSVELFDLSTDPAELKDLAADRPDKVREMIALWDDYVRRDNVVLPNRSPFETLEDQLPPRVPVQAGYPPLNLKKQFVPPPDMMADPK